MSVKVLRDKIGGPKSDAKKWTIMVYLAGSNNLVDEMIFAIRELRGKAMTGIVNVFVEFDTGSDVWLFPPSAFQEKPGTDPQHVEDFDLEKVGEKEDYPPLINTQGILRKFVTRAMLAYPDTEHYALILSGHGSGAVGDFLLGSTPGLTIPALGRTFKRVKDALHAQHHPRGKEGVHLFDILGLDSCNMSMAEIGYEVEEHVGYMIGAEGFELNTGWPYDRLIDIVNRRKSLEKSPCELAVDIVHAYGAYYFNYSIGDLSTDQSALYLHGLRGILKPVVKELADSLLRELKDASGRDRILVAHWKAQSYSIEQYTDLWDFCGQLKEKFPEPHHVWIVAEAVQKAIERVVMLSIYSGARFQHSHGVAIYFPWADIVDSRGGHDLSAYKQLKFARETGWAEFLEQYLEDTQREPREIPGEVVARESHLNARPGLFGTIAEHKGGGDDESKGGGDDESKGGGDDESKGLFSDESKGGGDDESKSGLQLSGLKIGEMKNPPTEWYPCDIRRATDLAWERCRK